MLRDQESLIDIVNSIRRILRYTDGIGKSEEIPWREMAGMRDVIVHKYDQLDLDVVWDIVENKLTELLKAIAPLL